MNNQAVREFFRRLGHTSCGATELVAIDRMGAGVKATGLFTDEEEFVRACQRLGGLCNLYAGRNPRKQREGLNKLDAIRKRRARDSEIEHLTAFSLDIDPIRPTGAMADRKQREAAVQFALNMQWDLGGWVDESGNGAYIWFAFRTPIKVADHRLLREKCRIWQEITVRRYGPKRYSLRVDGCFDLSRIKRVIGTINHKSGRLSRCVREGERSDQVRDEILSVEVPETTKMAKPVGRTRLPMHQELPRRFKRLLRWDLGTKLIWEKPDRNGDRSNHDWILGLRCVEAGIRDPAELAMILMNNPHGKYRRDGRREYVDVTVGKLLASRVGVDRTLCQ